MRILYVLPQLPYPADRGGKVVLHNIVEHMRRRHRVSIVALTHGPRDIEAAEAYRERVAALWTFPCRPRRHPGVLARAAFSPLPLKALRFSNAAMERKVAALCTGGGFDLVHAQNYYAAQYVRRRFPPAKVHYTENFEGALLERSAAHHPNPLTAALLRIQARRTERYEFEVCRRFDRVYAITRTDLERMRERAPDLPFEYLPASIDTETFQPSPSPVAASDLVFVGSLDYFPNIDGLNWFHREVLPRLRARQSDCRLVVVGHRPAGILARLARDPSVEFAGRVDRVHPFVHRAAVYVVPLRIGGGVRLKILEAMALGKAIVTTSIGCEGIECTPGRHLVVADGAETFAQAVLRLLAYPGERDRLARNARDLVVSRHSIPAVMSRLEVSYQDTIDRSGRGDGP